MFDRYEPKEFEAKWRDAWQEADLFVTREDPERPKFFGLDFFPYPSGAGLSVGHCRNYIPTDVICRMRYMQGYNVLHPMGFDSFGLPAENEAIKRQRHPWPMIQEYGATYRRQMDLVGVSYDWSRSFFSSEPSYYHWTQWIFKKLYERGLAYRRNAAVNWDPIDKTVLADEEIIGGRAERSGALVEKKLIPQWYFKITEYAQRLLDDLDDLNWPEGIKNQQRNWIGRSEGVQFRMKVDGISTGESLGATIPGSEIEVTNLDHDVSFEVFTTRVDTIFGMTFCVLAPEHAIVDTLLQHASEETVAAVRDYQAKAKELSDIDRQAESREKTGVFTGSYAINPANGAKVPIYLADYVLMGYGTGAIMAVPAHDQRDFEFAIKFGISVVPVIQPDEPFLKKYSASESFNFNQELANYSADPAAYSKSVYEAKDGVLMNSGEYSGLSVSEAQTKLGEWMEALEIGQRKVNFRLRDWLISRQRYWGCPIPVVHDRDGTMSLVPDDCLPVELPDVENYQPSDDGQSPLARIPEFLNTTTPDGTLGLRETDTMGGFACSSWYFLRFCDPNNFEQPWDVEKANYWMPVDCYVGGAEHAVMHLLYARFWTKVLYDLGLVKSKEPFARLQNQGQVLAMTPYRKPREGERLDIGEDGILISFEEAKQTPEDQLIWKWARMSKSKGNVVTPDEAVEQYGADALRVYELFVAPFDADVQWSNEGMQGAVRFLSRIFKLVSDLQPHYDLEWSAGIMPDTPDARKIRRWTHQTIQKVSDDIEKFSFNTAVSTLMIFVNNLSDFVKSADLSGLRLPVSEAIDSLVLLLAPIAPHTADEIWESLGHKGFTYHADWPTFEPELTVEDSVTVAVQVNGKLRDTLEMSASASQDEMESAAKSSEKIKVHLDGKEIVKVIVIPKKLVNIVVK
ncbi:MAG: leucine--tRNA ligase [Armatimonadetes bacterium]|nr:leucine--tRNA ligase [Armatimonadota bacterium]